MNLTLQKIINLPKDSKISLLPHDNADVDAIFSCILLSKLLDFFQIENEILIFDKTIAKDTMYICDIVGINVNMYIEEHEDKKRNLFLLDHFSTVHKGNVIGCIDHHPTENNIQYPIYEYRKSCATAYIIYTYMLEVNMKITKEIVELLGYAMLVDTCSFTSSKTVESESKILPDILLSYGLDYNKMCEISCLYTNIHEMTLDEISTNGLKLYDYNRGKVKSSYLQLKQNIDDELLKKVILKITNILSNEKLLLWIFIVYAIDEKKTYVYLIHSTGVEYKIYDRIISRGVDIMPKVEEMFNT